MRGQKYIRRMDRQYLEKKTSSYGCSGEIWKERPKVKYQQHKIRRYKPDIMQQRYWKLREQKQTMSTIWWDSGTNHNSTPNTDKKNNT